MTDFESCVAIVAIIAIVVIIGGAIASCNHSNGATSATQAIQTEITACNKQKMSYNRLEIREGSRGFVRCIDHRANQTKLVPVTY